MLIGGVHLLAVPALWLRTEWGAARAAVLYVFTGLGISLGYHRALTHGAFRCSLPLRVALTLLGALALQGGPLTWVAFHRAHHELQDEEGDPHAASRGFLWSHIGWTLFEGPNGFRKRRATQALGALARDRWLLFLERHHLSLNLATFIVSVAWLGPVDAIWCIPVRILALWHVTWLTNSLAHGAHNGSQLSPRNIAWLSIIGFGEGLHANHHAWPSRPCFARRPGEVDLGYWALRLLATVKLARLPSKAT